VVNSMLPAPPRIGIPGSLETIIKIAAKVEIRAICFVVSFFTDYHKSLG